MTAKQEFERRLNELLWNPPKSTYPSTSWVGTYEDTDFYQWKTAILDLIEEALPALAKEANYAKLERAREIYTKGYGDTKNV